MITADLLEPELGFFAEMLEVVHRNLPSVVPVVRLCRAGRRSMDSRGKPMLGGTPLPRTGGAPARTGPTVPRVARGVKQADALGAKGPSLVGPIRLTLVGAIQLTLVSRILLAPTAQPAWTDPAQPACTDRRQSGRTNRDYRITGVERWPRPVGTTSATAAAGGSSRNAVNRKRARRGSPAC